MTAPTPPAWNRRAERGNTWLIALMIRIALGLGWRAGRTMLYPITAYYLLSAPAARRASARFLARARGRKAGPILQFRHLLAFSTMLLDRIFFLAGRIARFRLRPEGVEQLTAALAAGRGVLLFGAHLGSFEALRAFGRAAPVRVRMLMYRANIGGFTRLMDALDPALAADAIPIGTPETMLAVGEALRRGEIVGVLADRAPEGGERILVPFLGAPAAFPTGPVRLAAATGAPVLLFFGLAIAPRRYDLIFEPFAERIVLPRAGRAEAVRKIVSCYADRLAAKVRAHPLQWFNFHEIWPEDAATSDPGRNDG